MIEDTDDLLHFVAKKTGKTQAQVQPIVLATCAILEKLAPRARSELLKTMFADKPDPTPKSAGKSKATSASPSTDSSSTSSEDSAPAGGEDDDDGASAFE